MIFQMIDFQQIQKTKLIGFDSKILIKIYFKGILFTKTVSTQKMGEKRRVTDLISVTEMRPDSSSTLIPCGS